MHYKRLVFGVAAAALLSGVSLDAASPRPPKVPAKISISVAPATVAGGGQAEVTLTLEPIDGVKINKYPQIKLEVPDREGLIAGGKSTLGSAKPPPPEKLGKNYFKEIEPLKLTLSLEEAAPSGEHAIEGKLTYYYCVLESGFCAPKKMPVSILLKVR